MDNIYFIFFMLLTWIHEEFILRQKYDFSQNVVFSYASLFMFSLKFSIYLLLVSRNVLVLYNIINYAFHSFFCILFLVITKAFFFFFFDLPVNRLWASSWANVLLPLDFCFVNAFYKQAGFIYSASWIEQAILILHINVKSK